MCGSLAPRGFWALDPGLWHGIESEASTHTCRWLQLSACLEGDFLCPGYQLRTNRQGPPNCSFSTRAAVLREFWISSLFTGIKGEGGHEATSLQKSGWNHTALPTAWRFGCLDTIWQGLKLSTIAMPNALLKHGLSLGHRPLASYK